MHFWFKIIHHSYCHLPRRSESVQNIWVSSSAALFSAWEDIQDYLPTSLMPL